jgi:predicted Zn-dependent protease
VRQQKTDKAVEELEAAARLAPENTRYIYVYAVALNSTGQADEAIKQLQIAHDRFPANVEILQALISFNRDTGNAFAAERYLKKLNNIE